MAAAGPQPLADGGSRSHQAGRAGDAGFGNRRRHRPAAGEPGLRRGGAQGRRDGRPGPDPGRPRGLPRPGRPGGPKGPGRGLVAAQPGTFGKRRCWLGEGDPHVRRRHA
ncbi:MAG: hypothetical protein E8A49_17730 [Phenylobacterium sp.]|nr:MAG: hypothetical protein E8A49_17730 [Phenylobacterium sp.]